MRENYTWHFSQKLPLFLLFLSISCLQLLAQTTREEVYTERSLSIIGDYQQFFQKGSDPRAIDTRVILANDALDKIDFDLSTVPIGMYYLEWQSGKERRIQKVIKQAF